jgi:hypothetical protein
MFELDDVTLISLTSVKISETIKAMEYSMKGIRFADAILFTHEKPAALPDNIRYIQVDRMNSVDDYNRIMLFELYPWIRTEHVLVIQWDGFVVHPNLWNPAYLNYDYIGAPWPRELGFHDEDGNPVQVGNGVGLRSRKLMEFPAKARLSWKPGQNEDVFLCCDHRREIEKAGMKFAPFETACRFSHERPIPECDGEPFMFHKWDGHNVQYPRFGEGAGRECKRLASIALIKMGVYDTLHAAFRKHFRDD